MKKKIKYITPSDLIEIIDIIENLNYENNEETPNYDNEIEGIDNYFALIDRSKLPYYPNIYSKAAFLFININNHYFSNGNKRIATVTTLHFLEKNNYSYQEKTKKFYKKLILDLFPNYTLIDFSEFDPINFALYNMALIVAQKNESKNHNINYDELKEKVELFFTKTFSK